MRREGAGARVLPAVLALVAVALFLGASARLHGLGFPLDDAWIHQTYARHLAERGEWAFLPGEPSAGSTSPLWTAALAVGRAAQIPPMLWTYGLGTFLLVLTAWIGAGWAARRLPDRAGAGLLAGGLLAVEWHLVWAGLSGMETLAAACLALGVLSLLDEGRRPSWLIGLLVGLGVWLRPDALTLALPLGWVLLVRPGRSTRQRVREACSAAAALALVVLPYLAFNRALSDEWWPSTFYAKQAEYAALRALPLAGRLAAQFGVGLVGAGALLAPGWLVVGWESLRRSRVEDLAPLLWAAGFLGLYALRLPVTYQHGRYAIPALPALLVVGAIGVLRRAQPRAPGALPRVVSRAWLAAAPLTAAAFLALGAGAYARDVAIIETEMVAAARWIAVHTEDGALIAAHDIGALGYFGGRRIVDLAGLVSPEVVPFLRDEQALAAYLDARGADYLMTFPGWYPELTAQARPVYQTGGRHSPAAGGENMAVYLWPASRFAPSRTAMLYSAQLACGRADHGQHRHHYR